MRFIHSGPVAVLALLSLVACSSFPELVPPAGSSGTSGAARMGSGGSLPASTLSVADQAFVTQATYGSLAEVTLGEMAMQRASSPEVRAFGQRMVNEHSQAGAELADLAEVKGMSPPTSPDPGRTAIAEALGALEGAEFDRQYLQHQMAEHEVAVALYRREASSGTDQDMRSFANRWLPVLQDHTAQIASMMTRTVGMAR
jgi:putative membrane protein